jgi:hypothetical protein
MAMKAIDKSGFTNARGPLVLVHVLRIHSQTPEWDEYSKTKQLRQVGIQEEERNVLASIVLELIQPEFSLTVSMRQY